MKRIILLSVVTMTLFSCLNTRSRKRQNREQYPPQKLFEDRQLQASQQIFDEDEAELTNMLQAHPELINQLSPIKGHTLLMYAAIIENTKAMETLLRYGADPNIIIPYKNSTPLSHAVATNNYHMAKLLFKFKASPNPAVGRSPLCKAMLLGGESTERKMVDFLLDNGANINHVSYLGDNIMEAAARSDLKTAEYFLTKGGKPEIEGTNLSPMAEYIQAEEQRKVRNSRNASYFDAIVKMKKQLAEKYHISFPIEKDAKAEAKLNMKLYENLSEKDKRSVNFNKNYGENRYQKDKLIVAE